MGRAGRARGGGPQWFQAREADGAQADADPWLGFCSPHSVVPSVTASGSRFPPPKQSVSGSGSDLVLAGVTPAPPRGSRSPSPLSKTRLHPPGQLPRCRGPPPPPHPSPDRCRARWGSIKTSPSTSPPRGSGAGDFSPHIPFSTGVSCADVATRGALGRTRRFLGSSNLFPS